jgi:chaperone required for assembly of F1-ATPase
VPLTQLAGTVQERIAPDPAPVAEALAKYAEDDLLCYRAEHPLPLVVRQAREWQPWLDWLERTHGARLQPTAGVVHVAQDEASLRAIRDAFSAQPPEVLAALGIAVPALGSAALGLALAEGALDAGRAHELACLDELFQVEQWGEDEWAGRRRADAASDVALAARFIALARAS